MSNCKPGNGKVLQLEQTLAIKLTLPLRTIHHHLTQMMLEVQREINGCGYRRISTKELRPVKRMAEFEAELRASEDAPRREYVLRRIAKFYKIHRLLQAGLSESYESLVYYAAELRRQAECAREARQETKRDGARDQNSISVAEEITADFGFLRMEEVALGGLGAGGYKHPKVEALITQCRNLALLKRRCLVFVGNKLLGETLADKLWASGIRAVTLMGARSGNQRRHEQAVQKFLGGQADVLICTSVLESEKAFPELEAGGIICYTLPHTKGSKEARSARGPSDEMSFITNLVASQSPDCTFWLLRRELQKEAAEQAIQGTQPPVQMDLGLTS